MKMSGRPDAVSSCSHRSKYGLAIPFPTKTNLVSHVMDFVQQPPCETFQSIPAELRSKPRGLIIEAVHSSTEVGSVITECSGQQIREPSHILLEARA